MFEGDESHPVTTAVVVVKTYGSGHTLRQTYTDPSTDSAGMYTVTANDDWAFVDTIEVTATYGEPVNQNTVTVVEDNAPFQHIDVPFEYAIPQLAGIGGAIAAMSVLGVVAIISLRKKPLRT